ncbi:hypothetical protein TCDM_12488 [Trypanosoma cruzi Dm28c]|uniref:Trans-sialidase n=1 Tax=Trypanosoma cruzi Dm28c TaxID=1416333 RepID=V5ARJ1_TRYCR|nr:hypothetical protein TCDM_12488 [Trypanosoma cruzi Dm28c]
MGKDTTAKRLAAARVYREGRSCTFTSRWFFLCGRRSVCADAWQKRPPWLLLVVVAIAVCSRCIVPPSLFMCLCT